jgi:hypothetical protein
VTGCCPGRARHKKEEQDGKYDEREQAAKADIGAPPAKGSDQMVGKQRNQ